MSGTQDFILAAQKSVDDVQASQAGLEQISDGSAPVAGNEEASQKLTPSQKMDELIRGTSSGNMKKEIEKLRKESAKYRTSSKLESEQKLEIQAKADEIQKELESLKKEHRALSIIQKLDKAGCIKSELVAKDIPEDLETKEDLEKFIGKYKEDNQFLFKAPKQNAGGTFKTSGKKNLTPSQQMDAYIRAALGR